MKLGQNVSVMTGPSQLIAKVASALVLLLVIHQFGVKTGGLPHALLPLALQQLWVATVLLFIAAVAWWRYGLTSTDREWEVGMDYALLTSALFAIFLMVAIFF